MCYKDDEMNIKELWSYHLKDHNFDLTSGQVDHSKSRYYNKTQGVKDAYPKLWQMLEIPSGQIVWCYTDDKTFKKTGIPYLEWHLKVPTQNILKYVDDIVWNRILGIRCSLPEYLSQKLRREGKKEEVFWNQQAPSGDWWNHLLLARPHEGDCWALIRHPVPVELAVGKRIIVC